MFQILCFEGSKSRVGFITKLDEEVDDKIRVISLTNLIVADFILTSIGIGAEEFKPLRSSRLVFSPYFATFPWASARKS